MMISVVRHYTDVSLANNGDIVSFGGDVREINQRPAAVHGVA